MKFLLDQGLPRSTVQHLQELGIDAEHVGDLGLSIASDETILEEGRIRTAIVVTLDSDFHALLAISNASSPSVIRINMRGLKGDSVARLIHQVVEAMQTDLVAGSAISVTERRIGLRRLPLLGDRHSEESDDEVEVS